MSRKTASLGRISDSVRHETRLSARLNETCIEALWVGLSLWVGTSDLPKTLKTLDLGVSLLGTTFQKNKNKKSADSGSPESLLERLEFVSENGLLL